MRLVSIFFEIFFKLMLMNALSCLHDGISQILRNSLEKKSLLDNLELIFLAVDEICDGGYVNPITANNVFRIIMECDSSALATRVGIKSEEMSLGEQTMSQVSSFPL